MRRSAFSILAGLLLGLSWGVQHAQAAAGSLDATFGTNGVTATSVANAGGILNSMLVVPSGATADNILVFVGGSTLVQYTSNGKLDTTFGTSGVVTLSTPITGSLALQSNGQIVIGGIVSPSSGGAELGVERLNSNGTPDTSFGSSGIAVVSLGTRAPNVGNAVLVYPSNVADSAIFCCARR